MSVYDRNRTPGRKPNWWVKYVVNGEVVREPGKESKKLSAAWEAELKRQIKAGTWVHPRQRRGNRMLFEVYAPEVIERRTARGVGRNELPPNKSERGHVANHLVPMFRGKRLDELKFLVIKDAFAALADKEHAGRTIRNIHSTLRAVLIEAVEDGLIEVVPAPLTAVRGHLPPPADKDEDWRDTAHFEPHEIRRLVGCADIASMRRVLYATYFLVGARAMELLRVRVSDYTPLQPWACLTLPASKVGRGKGRRRRHAPVFPELRAWLDWWLTEEYEVLYGRKPQPADLLFPTISVRRARRGEIASSHNEVYKQWQRNDLPAAGLRHRRLHDSRRTYISTLRSAGVPDQVIRAVTHASTGDRVLDAYTTWQWSALCGELSRVKWDLPKPNEVQGTVVVPIFPARTRRP